MRKNMKPKRKPNAVETRRAKAAAAMPDVKRMVKKYGRASVANCLHKIADFDKEVSKLAALKKEIAAREARLE